jgi:hypothetical protein
MEAVTYSVVGDDWRGWRIVDASGGVVRIGYRTKATALLIARLMTEARIGRVEDDEEGGAR